MLTNLQTLAKALGGEINGSQVLAPGPGHSVIDRSLSVKLDSNAPDGFLVHSFAGDDPLVCRDHVREKAGLEPFKPNGGGRQRAANDAIERALMAAVARQSRDGNKGRIVAKYDYIDDTGTLLYQVLRLEPKSFRQRRPDGNGRMDLGARPRAPRSVSLAGTVAISGRHRLYQRRREGRRPRRGAWILRDDGRRRQMDRRMRHGARGTRRHHP